MKKLRIFDIQRGSYVDGPGVRTVVFFKGCNLNCAWCHNPESKSSLPQILFYRNRCADCGRCNAICPEKAILPTHETDHAICLRCGKCDVFCPENARSLCGRDATADEIVRDLLRDKAYFDASDGGVTFSGGECMLQIDGLDEVLRKCNDEKIHTAVDTAGNVPWEYFERILPITDLFLYDIKHIDDEKHQIGTGVSNRFILDNLAKLLTLYPKKVLIRVPVIPGFNDDRTSLCGIGSWLTEFPKPVGVELLPYHSMGEHKAEAVGAKPFIAQPPKPEEFEQLKRLFFQQMEGNK